MGDALWNGIGYALGAADVVILVAFVLTFISEWSKP
jgi:hypothetical protein